MIHPLTVIHAGASIDESAQVWAFTVIGDGVTVGADAVIGSHCYIGRGTTIGRGVHIQTGVFLPNNSVVEDYAFIGPNVPFTDDRYPRSGNTAYLAEPPFIGHGASIGAGAVILPGIKIGAGSMVGAGSVVAKNVGIGDTIYGSAAKVKNGTDSFRSDFPPARA